jgi:hypothetical protein
MKDYREYQIREQRLNRVDTIVNDIIEKRTYPKLITTTFLLVEGPSDERFFQSHTHAALCQIIIADGKENIQPVLSLLEKEGQRGILAIVDADFDILEGRLPASPNVLFTDTHDLETMMLQSPALEKILMEFASHKKCAAIEAKSGKELRTILLECGKHIGYLRWISLQENLSLDFKDLSFEKFIDKETLAITDILKLIRIIQSKTRNSNANKSTPYYLEDSDIHDKMIQIYDEAHDPWHICCGHDLTHILSLGLRKAIGSTNKTEPDFLESCLRLAYEPAYFSNTRLYADTQNWEKANIPFVVLATQSS